MAYQAVFKRYEMKYMLTSGQKQRLLEAMAPHMALDKFGRSTIRNVYFDTPNYRLIRRSLEKPDYKEKLRIRSYRRVSVSGEVFVEIKKKYNGVVYKRRVSLPEAEAVDWLAGRKAGPDSQIGREIDYFLGFYAPLRPSMFLSYEREAYYCRDGGDFRVTFDENILARPSALTLESEPGGTALLPEGNVLMEIKTSGAIPLWMVEALSRERIYKTSFSKYGKAYEKLIFSVKGGYIHA